MDDFSLYQWLVLGLLSLIAFLIWAVGMGIDHNLRIMVQRLERALAEIREETEKVHLEIGAFYRSTQDYFVDF